MMERNGPYHMVPGNEYPYPGDRDRAPTQDKPYPDHPTSERVYPNNSTQDQDRAYPEKSSQDRLYPNNVTLDPEYGDRSPHPDMEMKNLQDRNERNKNRELPEKPKAHQDGKTQPEKKKEEDLRWGPRLFSFTQVTTVHGLRQIWEPTPFRIRRILWVIIVLAGLILFIKQLIASILYYCSYPAAVNVRINYNDTLMFPAITICNINSFRTTIAARQGRYDMISHLFTMQDSMDPMSYFTGEEGNITMDELYLDAAHNKHDLIVGCVWDKQECSADDFEEVLTDHGVCYSFNTGKNSSILKVGHTGADRGLRLRLNIEQYEYMTGPNDGAGLKILVHDQEQFPLVRDLGQAVPPGAHAFVGIQILQIHNLKEPYGPCDDEVELEYFDSYSPSSCYVNCKQKYLLEKCGCREFYMPPGMFMEEETRVCMMFEYVQCIKPHLEIFEQEERKTFCKCPIPCDRNLFDPIITYAANSNFDMDKVLQNNIEILEERYHAAREISQKVNPRIVRNDRLLIKDLSDSIRDVDDTFADIDTKLNEAVNVLENSQAELLNRVAFHRDVALYGVDYIIEHDFIRGWEVLEERTLNALTSGFYEILSSMDRFIQQQNTLGSDGSGDTGKDVLWVIIDANLANKLDIIQRARLNISQVNMAYTKGEPIVQFKFSVGQRYDMALIPTDIVHHNEEKREYYFRHIMNGMDKYVENLNTLRDIGKTYASDGKLNRDEYEETKVSFVKAAKNVNYRIFQYRDRIIQRSLELVRERISNFESLNETLKLNSEDLRYLVDSTSLLVHSQKLSHWRHMRKAGLKCNGYMQDFNASKTELSEFLNSGQIQEDLIRLENFFSSLRSRATEVLDLWVKTEQSYKNIWRSMISEPMTQEFYTMLNNDTKTLMEDPENNTDTFFPIFGELLGLDEESLNKTNVTEFMQMLNADLPDINLESKMKELEELFTKLTRQSDITSYIRDRDKAFLSIMKKLQNSLAHFAARNELGFEFYRENFLHLDIFMRELSYEEIIQRKAYGLTNLWSDIGGSLGLFLGASAITVFELLDVFLHHAAKRRARTRKQLKAEKEKEQQNNPQAVPIKRSRQDMPFDDDPFYHPPFPQHQYTEPEYSEIPRPRHKRPPHSRHEQPDRNRSGSRRGPSSRHHRNYDAPAAYQLQPERHNRRRRSRSKSPRDYHQ